MQNISQGSRWTLILSMIILGVSLATQSFGQRAPQSARISWEYKELSFAWDAKPADVIKKVNELGAQGWEMCGTYDKIRLIDGNGTSLVQMVFKRER